MTFIRITTNNKKYHFSGKKKTNKPSVKPKATVYKFNSIKKYFAPVYVSFKKPFKWFFNTFYSNWIFRKRRAKKSIIYKPCWAVQRMVIQKKKRRKCCTQFSLLFFLIWWCVVYIRLFWVKFIRQRVACRLWSTYTFT